MKNEEAWTNPRTAIPYLEYTGVLFQVAFKTGLG
jgi:hypothetical protein